MSNLIIPILYIVIVANGLMTLIISSRGIKSITNVLFILISLVSLLWTISILGFYSPQLSTLLPWVIYTHFSALVISLVVFYFSWLFPNRILNNKVVLILAFLPFIGQSYLLFSNQVVVPEVGLAYRILNGYVTYALLMMIYFGFSYYGLVVQYKKTKNYLEKNQVKYVMAGVISASGLAIIPDLILPYFKFFNYTWLGPIFTLILVITIFLAIVKYKLFNIRVIITEIFTGLIIITLIAQLILSETVTNVLINTIILLLVSVFGYLLLKGVYKEIQQREKIESLAKDLEKSNKDLENANERLQELDKMKTEFISLATHQIRSPLTAIKGYISLIQEGDYGPVSPEVLKAIDVVFQSTNNLVTIVGDFLDVSRIEQGRMKYDFKEFDVQEIAAQVVTELKPNVEKRGLQLNYTFEKDKDYKIFADLGKIKQIIGNIVDNSIKYTPSGKIDIAVLKPTNFKVLIRISDTGVGIDPRVIPKLFQKFTRAENANEVNIIGTGLGLYVAKQMIEAHQGRVWAESEGVGKGSQFYIELPVKSIPPEAKSS